MPVNPMHMSIEIFGDKVVNRALLRMSTRALNAKPAFRLIQKDLQMYADRQFETQGRFAGGSWQRLKRRTIMAKRRHKPRLDPRIEHATRKLRRSLTKNSGPNTVRRVGKDYIEYGTNLPYAQAQHRGMPSKNLPARPLIKLDETHRRLIVKRIQAHIVGKESEWAEAGKL